MLRYFFWSLKTCVLSLSDAARFLRGIKRQNKKKKTVSSRGQKNQTSSRIFFPFVLNEIEDISLFTDYAMFLRSFCVRVERMYRSYKQKNPTKILFWINPPPVIPWMAYSRKRFFSIRLYERAEIWTVPKKRKKKKKKKMKEAKMKRAGGSTRNWIEPEGIGYFVNLSFTHFDIISMNR